MKPKGLLFALFILYWIVVYGVALFSGKIRSEFRQSTLSHFVPYGYSMFTPMTKTKFDVSYEFYENGKPIKILSLREYIDAEYDKGLLYNKTAFVKSKIYLDQIYQLDLAFQKNQYARMNNPETKGFEDVIQEEENLNSIIRNIQNFSKLYIEENPSLTVDSVIISVRRKPMILPYKPDYTGDYTYVLGDTVFYHTDYIFPNSIKNKK